jgi:hypothetical protein
MCIVKMGKGHFRDHYSNFGQESVLYDDSESIYKTLSEGKTKKGVYLLSFPKIFQARAHFSDLCRVTVLG